MKKRVVITGIGAVTPIGNTAADSWKSLLAGESGTDLVTQIDPKDFPSKVAAEVKDFDPTLFMAAKDARRADRFVQFAVAGSKMALDDADFNLDNEDPSRCGVIVGSGIGGLRVMEKQHNILLEKGPSRLSPFMIPMLICNMASGIVAIETKFKGPNTCVVTACASGSHSIGDAFKVIQRGDADVMIAGGTESCITELGFGGFCAMKALSQNNDEPKRASRPFDKTRSGFVMGEGAGVVVLEDLEHALKRGANIYCEVVGYGLTCDAYHIAAPDQTGEAAAKCFQLAMQDAKINPEDVTYINAHGTSTSLNDSTETKAIKLALGEDAARKVMISSTKSMTGHLLGAAGGIEAIASACAIKENVIPPTINYKTPDPECDLDYTPNEARKVTVDVALSNSLGFGGHNATLAFKKYVS